MSPGSLADWVRSNRSVYIGNATTMRDFRVQLRGSRSVLLFGLYLVVLILVSFFVYGETASRSLSIVDAQMQLKEFASTVMRLLGFTVSVVAPGLTATTIVMERQRQSLDLVFSAPVSPKYYLVGKVMSSFRYTWMLLVLALPVTAASVVIGGASWQDVLVAYMLLSMQALILTAFALLMSTIAAKPVSAIVWSYAASFFYNLVAISLASVYSLGRMFGSFGRGNEAPWYVTASPFTVLETSRTVTMIGGHSIPNWICFLAVALLLCRICLLGAGALLSPPGGKEIQGLRLSALVYVFALAIGIGWALHPHGSAPMTPGLGMGTVVKAVGADDTAALEAGQVLALCSGPIIVFLPFVACFGFDRERRYWPNGLFSIPRALDGTPAGGLPFLCAFLALFAVGMDLGALGGDGALLGQPFWAFAFYTAAFWVLFFALGRFVSSFFAGLKTSRTMLFALFLFLVCLPFPFLTMVTGVNLGLESQGPWNLYVLAPLLSRDSYRATYALIFGAILLLVALVVMLISESRVSKRLAVLGRTSESTR